MLPDPPSEPPSDASSPPSSPRVEASLNRDWKFVLGDPPGAEAPDFPDQTWSPVGLPHSFSLPYFLSPEFHTGPGWYRRRLSVPGEWMQGCVRIELDGVFQVAEIFANGRKVGGHRGGYTGFFVDLTGFLREGENLLAVRVDNTWHPELAPRAGEHVFSGGIYRNVRLVVTRPLHVAWYGTFVTTPRVSAESATVHIETEIENAAAEPKTCTVRSEVVDAVGRTVATVSTARQVPPGARETFAQDTPEIPHPRLWSPEHPELYAVVTTVLDGAAPSDTTRTTFGFRWFAWTADRGFFLNGAHRYLRGVNAHQDHAGWGDAVTDRGFARDLELVKQAGFDFVRGSHYPHAPAFSAACDRLGLLFWAEGTFWGTAPFDSPWGASAYPPEPEHQGGFEESVKTGLRELVRIHRNHPSIVVWSLGNEAFFTAPSTLPDVRRFLGELVAFAHALDPTRPAAVGGVQRGELDRLGDVAGYNGDGARLFIEPGVPSMVTEYGSTIALRPGSYEPGFGDLQAEEFAWRSGQALWCAFDHGSIAGQFGCMGMVDHFRLPKRQWYWYRDAYRRIPPPAWPAPGTPAGLRLTADQTVIRGVDALDDAQVVVTVVDADGRHISHSPEVTLSIESGPGEFPTGRTLAFGPDSDIAIRDGQAAIELRSYAGGSTVIRARSPGLKDGVLTIVTEGAPRFVAGETPVVLDRPYIRYSRARSAAGSSRARSAAGYSGAGSAATAAAPLETNVASPPELVLGRDTPARASAEAPGHPARHGNDGRADTFWSAPAEATAAWWETDLERLCLLEHVELRLPEAADHRTTAAYTVEISRDRREWSLTIEAVDRAQEGGGLGEPVFSEPFPPGSVGRFVRIGFAAPSPGARAAIADLSIRGRVVSE